ncbi:GIY-YIG nuclease family protein [Xylanimonas protaetiae]|uniref:GIY-YIG nuclease family protein n=1 Tax=Xylanimonas protaetiae TaxID=2509457 RepID=A0A4P6F5M9_9MICO|nr:GIY-YIG nuclease family protein [Xylanimonas protaetiae]QAY69559.1 GIY-YIG nuclease family protein [Xylanimonas protaetiae]
MSEFADEVVDGPPSLPLSPRDELGEFIAVQDGRLGEVYRLWHERPDARWIADQQNVASVGYIYGWKRAWEAALDGAVPNGPTALRQTIGSLNSLLKKGRGTLSLAAIDLLKTNRALIIAAADEVDVEEAAEASAAAESIEKRELAAIHTAGIYAFSYGWYLESPIDPEGGNTLIKVGKAEDVASRLDQHRQGARAHIPEPLVTIRVYETGSRDLDRTERDFHRLLGTAGHSNPRREESLRRTRNEVGREWFLTNADFLDAIAGVLELRTVYSDENG